MNKLLLYLITSLLAAPVFSQRQMEYLNRGIVAVPDGKGHVFVSWRMLATDADNIAFNLYRTGDNKIIKLNAKPITAVTSWLDEKADATQSYTYQVAAIVNGKEIKELRVPVLAFPIP